MKEERYGAAGRFETVRSRRLVLEETRQLGDNGEFRTSSVSSSAAFLDCEVITAAGEPVAKWLQYGYTKTTTLTAAARD